MLYSRLFYALSGIAQTRRNPVDRNMNPSLHPLVGLACTVAAHQLDLQVVQGVDVGETVADGALQGGVVGQALFVAGDQLQRSDRQMPFGFNAAENLFAQGGIGHQFCVSGGQGQVAFRQNHVDIAQQGAKKWPVFDHFLQECELGELFFRVCR